MSIRVSLSPRLYPGEAIDQAISAYSNHCSARICHSTAKERIIELIALEGIDIDEANLTREFLNYLLDVSVEAHLRKVQQPGL